MKRLAGITGFSSLSGAPSEIIQQEISNRSIKEMSNNQQAASPPDGFISIDEHEEALAKERKRYSDLEAKLKNENLELKRKLRQASFASMVTAAATTTPADDAAATSSPRKQASTAVAASATSPIKKKGRYRRVVYSKHDERWNEKYEELKAFKEEHGHCNIKKGDEREGLLRWVASVRTSYHKQKKGIEHLKGVTLSEERIKRLNDLNFEWRVRKNMPLAWEARYDQLLEFRDQHSHVRVPQNHTDPQGLGHWVFEQRKMYMRLKLGKKTYATLTPERIGKLEAIGFIWSLKNAGERSAVV